jgi:hypothetical protein
MLAAERELAYPLTVEPCAGGAEDDTFYARRWWTARFGELLREVAGGDPRPSREPAPFLIGGVRFQIVRLVLNGEASELLRLLPGPLDALLAYYFEPGEPRDLARAALAGEA